MADENPLVENDLTGDDFDENPLPPPRRSWLSQRNVLLLLGVPLLIILLLLLAGFVAVRTGYVGRYLEQQVVAQLDDIGIRTEIGAFEQTFSPLGVNLRDVKLYDKQNNDLIATIKSLKLAATVTDLYALNLRRNVRLDSAEIDGLEAFVKFDEQGNVNLLRYKIPESENSRLTFSFSAMKFRLLNSIVHYGDVQRKLSGDARNVQLFVEPDEGVSKSEAEVENRRFKFDLAATDSNFVLDDKKIEPIDVNIKGVATESYAEIAELKLKSPLAETVLSGKLENFNNLKYKFNVVSATVDLQKTQETLQTNQALRGFASVGGTIEGEGANYTADLQANSDALAADNVRLQGLRVNASVAGQADAYEANGKAVAQMLSAGDFQLDAMQLAGRVMGSGTDFRFLGDLRAAAAKLPGGSRIADLILADAVADYRDSKLTADVAQVSAQQFTGFDAKVQQLRASRAKVTNQNGVTNATVNNLRAASVSANGANLRGVNASDIKIQDRANGGTNVQVGNLQAQNLKRGDTNVDNLRTGNATVAVRGKNVTVNADNIAAGNVTSNGVNINNVRIGAADVENSGRTTNVDARDLQIGSLTTPQAVLGSLNIAGARLKIVGSRVEGSTSDISAGNIALTKSAGLPNGGTVQNVRLARPVFVVESPERYRASADLSLGGGVLGSIKVGAARANVTATNGQVELQNLNAQVLEGSINGNATVVYEGRATSRVAAKFENVDVAKLLALSGGQVVPVAGRTSGTVDLAFPGLNFRQANGSLNANLTAEAGADAANRVPLTGQIGLRATNGLFDIERANFKTEKSQFNATGRFDLSGANSNLQLALNSTDARELQRIVAVLNVAPALDKQLAQNNIALGGNFAFNGTVTGNLQNPNVDGRANLESVTANNKNLGSLATDLSLQNGAIALSNGSLTQPEGGNLKFDVNVPNGGANNVAVNARLNQVDLGGILAALPAIGNSLPTALKNINAKANGAIALTGVPNNINGTAEITSENLSIGGEPIDSLNARVVFQNPNVNIERFDIRAGDGRLSVTGNYLGDEARFNAAVIGTNIEVQRFRAFLGDNPPQIAGTLDLKANGTGELAFNGKGSFDAAASFKTFDINFDAAAKNLTVNQTALGEVTATGRTQNQQLNTNITANVAGQQQTVLANVNLADETLPFRAETSFNNTDLAPLLALAQAAQTKNQPQNNNADSQAANLALGGRATGKATFGGALRSRDAKGDLIFSTDNLRGEAAFSTLTLQVQDVVLAATDPLSVSFSPTQVTFNKATFAGSGSNLSLAGTAVFGGAGISDLKINGTLNLRILNALADLNVLPSGSFVGGQVEVMARLTGPSGNARLIGTTKVNNANFTTNVGDQRITLTNVTGNILFTTNQAQVESLEGRLGGGRITASGGVLLDNLSLQSFRFDVRGQNVSAPLIADVRTNADAELQISGVRRNNVLQSQLSGNIFARRVEYNKNFEIADFLNSRGASVISTGVTDDAGALSNVNLDLRIEGNNALAIRNNVADLTGSLNLRVTGTAAEPIIAGRVTANGGTIELLNRQRYDITRATVDFPGQADASPVVNFQGEGDINGYQVFLSASGALSDPQNLTLNLRSNPPLPQADVVSLVTTGSLSNEAGGIPTLAQTGINTAADVVTDALISAPIRRATDRLFGLNRFQIDPTLTGERGVQPGARLTVGRQINRNLSVTFSTNLSQDRSQIVALEYRVSNKVSLIAQYENAPLSNVTRRTNSFSVEVRFRRRF